MRQLMQKSGFHLRRRGVASLVLAVVLAGSTGLECDGDAQAAFREGATTEIGNGVKTIVNGVLDGWIAAIDAAGDEPATDDTTTTTGE